MNYCRQIANETQRAICNANLKVCEMKNLIDTLALCSNSTKFLLPVNGILLDDPELRALDDSAEFRLPYPTIALEWRQQSQDENTITHYSKCVLFAVEEPKEIVCRPLKFVDAVGKWAIAREFRMPRIRTIRREEKGPMMVINTTDISLGEDAQKDAPVLLSFINALQCSNVHTERLPARKPTKNAKTTIPFDEYRILTIDVSRSDAGDANGRGGTHRSPREHLRRGHIVRPEGRRPFWRNATVVNAGRSLGVVHKDYRVKSSAHHE